MSGISDLTTQWHRLPLPQNFLLNVQVTPDQQIVAAAIAVANVTYGNFYHTKPHRWDFRPITAPCVVPKDVLDEATTKFSELLGDNFCVSVLIS